MVRGMADWWVTSSEHPPVCRGKWNGHTLLIRLEDPAQMRKERLKKPKHVDRDVKKQETQKTPLADKVYSSDPWAKMKSRSGEKEGVSSSGPSVQIGLPSQSASASSQGNVSMSSDPRLSALSARMDAYERKHTDLAGKVGELDGKIEGLGVSMSQQFSQVMQGLQALSQQREDTGQKHPRTA